MRGGCAGALWEAPEKLTGDVGGDARGMRGGCAGRAGDVGGMRRAPLEAPEKFTEKGFIL